MGNDATEIYLAYLKLKYSTRNKYGRVNILVFS